MAVVAGAGPEARAVASVGTTATSTAFTFPTRAITAKDVGRPISGTGIPAGATIAAVGSTTGGTLSAAATATGTITATVGTAGSTTEAETAARAHGHRGWVPLSEDERYAMTNAGKRAGAAGDPSVLAAGTAQTAIRRSRG